MGKISPVPQPSPGKSLRLSNVDWTTYSALLRLFAERPGLRFTYDRSELEIRAPLPVSRSFPLVAPADLLPFVQQARQAGDENTVIRQFRAWVRQRHSSGGAPANP